jgi:hypothetical protein
MNFLYKITLARGREIEALSSLLAGDADVRT